MKTLTKLLAVVLVLVMCMGMFGSGAYALVSNNGLIGSDIVVSNGSDIISTNDNNNDPAPSGGSGLVGNVVNNPASSGESGLIRTDGSDFEDDDKNDDKNDDTEKSGIISSSDDGKTLEGALSKVGLNGEAPAYRTIAEALAAASGDTVTVTLDDDLAEAGFSIPTALRTVYLNLNGKTLDLGAGTITVNANNKLVISSTGAIKGTGTMITTNAATAVANIWDGEYSGFTAVAAGTDGVVTLYGGTYKNIDILTSGAGGKRGTAVIPDDCVVKKETKDSVDYYTLVGAVAKIGSVTHASVYAAILAANASDTIMLMKDSAAEELTITKALTIDLNGHALNLSKTMTVNAPLTIIDSASGGKVVGPAAGSTLFTVNDTSYTNAVLNISGGYMSNYATLYTRQSTGTTTPVNLYHGSSYEVKPTNSADIESGYVVAGSGKVFYLVQQNRPTITDANGVLYDYDLYVNGLANGCFLYDPLHPTSFPGNYDLKVSSDKLTSIKIYQGATEKSTVPITRFDKTKLSVLIRAEDNIYKNSGANLIAGLYMVRFTFDEGSVDVPLYILPTVSVEPDKKTMPDASAAGVTFTFGNNSEAASFASFSVSPNTGNDTADKKAAKKLVATTDYTVATPDNKVLTLKYDYINKNCVDGTYYLYCNYDNALSYRVRFEIDGKTDLSSNPPVKPTTPPSTTPTAAPTTAPSSSPTSTTATVSKNTANPGGLWYKGYSGSLKFNVTPANATIKVGGSTLTNGTDYSISNGVLTINNSYLNNLPYKHDNCTTKNAPCANGSYYILTVTSPDGSTVTDSFQLRPYFAAVNGVVNHTYGGSNTLTFVTSDPIEEVYVGGTLLSTNYYTLSNYNRTLTLSSAFLNNQLTLAEYTLTVIVRSSVDNQQHKPESIAFRNVTASYAASTTYAMGDNNNIYIWIAVLAICAVAVVALIPKKKKLPADAPVPEDKKE